jgi:hypothetical protein
MSPPPLAGTIPSGSVYNVPGIGNVTVTHSFPGFIAVQRGSQPFFIYGSVTAGPDTYPWSNYEYFSTISNAVNIGPDPGTVTFTLPGTLPAGSVFIGTVGLGATTSFGGGTSTTTVAQNGTYLGEFIGDPAFGPTQFNPGVGTFSLQNSLTAPGGLNPNWNTNLGVVRIDDPVSSITVTQSGLRGDGIGVAIGFAGADQIPGSDHFTCYSASPTKGSTKFPGISNPPGVSLVDQFGSSTAAVAKPTRFCAPTDKNEEDPTAPSHPEHLRGYRVKPSVKPLLPGNVLVSNQFGSYRVTLKSVTSLLVPTAKSLVPPAPAAPVSPATDHFQCYKIAVAKNSPKFFPVANVALQDQFGPLTVTVKKPTLLCAPVDKNGETPGAETHSGHLVCYSIKVTGPKFARVNGALITNQFGSETLDVKKPTELCVPSAKTP